jgi:hypothetical protein
MTPARRIAASGEGSPHFGPNGTVWFRYSDGKANYVGLMNRDGSARREHAQTVPRQMPACERLRVTSVLLFAFNLPSTPSYSKYQIQGIVGAKVFGIGYVVRFADFPPRRLAHRSGQHDLQIMKARPSKEFDARFATENFAPNNMQNRTLWYQQMLEEAKRHLSQR